MAKLGSFRPWFRAATENVVVKLLGGIAFVVGIVAIVTGWTPPPALALLSPVWLIVVALAFWLGGSYLAYHDVRIDSERVKADLMAAAAKPAGPTFTAFDISGDNSSVQGVSVVMNAPRQPEPTLLPPGAVAVPPQFTERPPWLDADLIRDRTFRIADLLLADGMWLRGKTFINCTIYGPAIVVPRGKTSIIGPTFLASSVEAILWEIAPSRDKVLGPIALEDCLLEDCTFIMVGVAGEARVLDNIRRITSGPGERQVSDGG